jgi:hypothetical protein
LITNPQDNVGRASRIHGAKAPAVVFLLTLNPTLAGAFFSAFGGEPNGDHAELQCGLDAKKFDCLDDGRCLVGRRNSAERAGDLPKILIRQRYIGAGIKASGLVFQSISSVECRGCAATSAGGPTFGNNKETLSVCCVAEGWHMAKPKRNTADDTALQNFYESCEMDPKTIERAIELRYHEPPRTVPSNSDIAKRIRRGRRTKKTEG